MSQTNEKDISSPALSEIWTAIKRFPQARWDEALSKGQMESKLWLVNILDQTFSGSHFEYAFVLAGWYGLLARMLLDECEDITFDHVRSFDLDPSCEAIADTVNRKWVMKDWTFKAATIDINEINYQEHRYIVTNSRGEKANLIERPDLIINTSCEHLTNFDEWMAKVPGGIPLVLQSNNYFSATEHKNCVSDLDEFLQQAALKRVLFQGTKEFSDYKRFMIIGEK